MVHKIHKKESTWIVLGSCLTITVQIRDPIMHTLFLHGTLRSLLWLFLPLFVYRIDWSCPSNRSWLGYIRGPLLNTTLRLVSARCWQRPWFHYAYLRPTPIPSALAPNLRINPLWRMRERSTRGCWVAMCKTCGTSSTSRASSWPGDIEPRWRHSGSPRCNFGGQDYESNKVFYGSMFFGFLFLDREVCTGVRFLSADVCTFTLSNTVTPPPPALLSHVDLETLSSDGHDN